MKPRGSNREKSFGKPQQKPFRRASDGSGEDNRHRERRDEARSESPRRDTRDQRRERPDGPPSPFGGRNRDRRPERRDRQTERKPGSERFARDDRPRRDHDASKSRSGRDFRAERGERTNRREMRDTRPERPQRGAERGERFTAERKDRAPFRRDRESAPQRREDDRRQSRYGAKPARPSFRPGSPDRDRPRSERTTPARDTKRSDTSRSDRREDRRPEFTDRRAERQRFDRRALRDSKPRFAVVPSPSPSGEGVTRDGAVVVSRRGAQRLRSGNPWVYRSDVMSANGIKPGAAVPVLDDRGKPLGTALYSSSSQIAIRMIASEPLGSNDDLLQLIRQRVRSAIAYRDKVVSDSDAFRIVFSEADLLPGLIVDRYNDVISLQALTQAMDREDIRAAVLDELVRHYEPAGVLERVEPRIRELEQLPPREPAMLHGEKSSTTFTMNGLKFAFDGMAGQKTGAFLDQRENYAAAAQYAHGEAIDICCYQGGFALHLARVCDQVTGVDVSRPALEVADQNAAANSEALGDREIEWIEANAFDLLRDYSDEGKQYDTIVLDPPAFAKTHKNLETALRGYKELNLRALKMLRPGGVLVTCSCSFHVSEADFMQMLAEAAADAHRSLRIVEKRSQAKDHPVLLAHPESHYLKCIIAIAE